MLPTALQRFLEVAPEVDVSVADVPPAQVIDMVVHQRVHLGIIATVDLQQLHEAYGEDLHIRHCGDLKLVAGLPPRMHDAPEEVSLADLHKQTWLIPARSLRIQSLEDSFNSLWAQLHLPPPHVRPVTTLQTAIPLVVAGLGVTLLPQALRSMSHPELVVRDIVESVPPFHIAVVWPKRQQQPPAMQTLLHKFSAAIA